MSLRNIPELLRSVWGEIQEDNCIDLAAQTSFYFILVLFPFFIVLAAITSYFPLSDLRPSILNWIVPYLPIGSRNVLILTIFSLTQGRGSFLSFGVAASAWSASSGVVSLMDTLNTAYEVREARAYWKRRLVALGTLLVICLFFVVGFGLITVGGDLGDWLGAQVHAGHYVITLWRVARWVVSITLLVLGTVVLERVLPNARYRWRWVSVGAIFAVATSIPASLGFRFHIQHFTSYARTYGALGAISVLMLWIYMEG